MMMWLPTLFAFFLRFTSIAQLLGLGMAAAISVTRAGAAPSIPMSEEVNQALMNA